MAEETPSPSPQQPPPLNLEKDPVATYLGISFWVFLSLVPQASMSYTQYLHSRVRSLAMQLFHAEEQIRQMRSRRKEDSKANARVVEIFASHRNEWQEEERRLVERVERDGQEMCRLKERVAELEREGEGLRSEVESLKREREEMVVKVDEDGEDLVEKKVEMGGDEKCGKDLEENFDVARGGEEYLGAAKFGIFEGGVMDIPEVSFTDRSGLKEMMQVYKQNNGFGRDFFSSVSQSGDPNDRSRCWQDMQYHNSPDAHYPVEEFLPRREFPWKVDGDSTGVKTKLKLIEQDLVNLEKLVDGGLSKVPSLLRKQAKRYRSLSAKIYDFCQRMQSNDPIEPTLGPELRTQRQTEFLLETFRLQHRATETRQKLTALQVETAGSCMGDELSEESKASTRKSLEYIRNSFKEIQRNLEVLLARIMGDLEGILATEGASQARNYCVSRYQH